MKWNILHESPGRIRVHAMQKRMTMAQADILEYYLKAQEGVIEAKVYDRTGDAVIFYEGKREGMILALSRFSYKGNEGLVPSQTGRALNREYEDKLVLTVVDRVISTLFYPIPLKRVITGVKAIPYLFKGLQTLFQRKIEVSLLDAVAISASILTGDYDTASSVMFLLSVGEILEEWTHKKSVDDLARTMSLNVDKVWTLVQGEEVLLPLNEVEVGQEIIVRTGNMIPLDGKVSFGEAMVNQASMTGESIPVRKKIGSSAYAGTVVEEGECRIRVEKLAGSGRYDRIVKMIEESEKLKSATEDKASHLADKLVPYSLGGAALTYLLTRNVTKALAFLMVDFSCALKLSMPVAVLSAMREAGKHKISVKGGKFMEAISEANTIVFDKTGTLTYAKPKVEDIITFNNADENEMLRMAACLEEHYPHSMANAVVAEAEARDLHHAERHSKVEYVVAHGISSIYEGKHVLIGSHHFIFDDEHCTVPKGEEEKLASIPPEHSALYLAVDGELTTVILISDPLRKEAVGVIQDLKALGIDKVVMMTGDNKKTAHAVARMVGVDEFHAEVLPEDKASFIQEEHRLGRKVIMVGDGINDSPALSEADAGIAISAGAAIAKEVADITIQEGDLYELVILKKLSNRLMKRIHGNYNFIIGFNAMLIALGLAGIMTPSNSALFHNISTIATGLKSMTPLIPEEEIEADKEEVLEAGKRRKKALAKKAS
ncbi:heavy metal translocating P-type ATPase [Oribacterium sinus]|jgi:heavy metal translocating P-type ATPase|uniref:Cd(2+)-exporting ATPase n=2 Tax=Oribacterium TaxID=265975 RepID=C2KXM9_9FIRM|nr:heavy metal translocating P-type ATPase [Oribacterium sinus]EEJ51487.1 heavy metal translocating P-type ATPase [Oribacterium sinus F0268]